MYQDELIIRNIRQSIPLTDSEAELVLSLLETREYGNKDFLLRQGDVCRYDYFITEGCAKVCYSDDKGNECIVKFAPENWWAVDLDSFINSKPCFYYIQAIEETEALLLSKQSYDRLHEKIPQFQKFSNQRWQQGFIALQQRVIQNLSLSADERYSQFEHKYPGLEQRISQKLIASYLGITPEFLSMLRRKRAAKFS